MTNYFFTDVQVNSGRWEAVLRAATKSASPEIMVKHLDIPLPDIKFEEVQSDKNAWHISVGIPIESISDGIQIFRVYVDDMTYHAETFTILTGKPLEDDIRAEVRLLREELDMMKKAFRRHALEPTH